MTVPITPRHPVGNLGLNQGTAASQASERPDHTGGITDGNRALWNIFHHHGAGTNYCIPPNSNAWQHYSVITEPDTVFDDYGPGRGRSIWIYRVW